MIHPTKGIVLNFVRYAETSIVVNIYTELFGKQSYLVNAVRKSRNKGKSMLMQPLSMLDMQVYHSPKKNLQRIKEFKTSSPLISIPFVQMKRSMAFFLTEVMNKSLSEEVQDNNLYNFVESAIYEFDKSEDVHFFHLSFLAQLSHHLGFFPDLTDEEQLNYFDLQNGHLTQTEPLHTHFIKRDLLGEWIKLFQSSKKTLTEFRCLSIYRDDLIDSLIDYYRLHLHDFGKIKSLDVLRSMYHNS